ncbi:MAG: hypothetical protein H0T89_15905, partial [Deltaproteobacteria bacterium]|nr:hypothetical protein [Deltaproteobacteria bacterium]
AGALGRTRAAIARCKLALADDALVRIGARAVAPYLDALGHRQLVLRLPRPRGLVIAGELARHAHDPRDAAPAWAALTGA